MGEVKQIMYKPTEVAEMVGVTASTVYRWLRNGEMASVRRGTRFTRITQAQLDAFVERYEMPIVLTRYEKRMGATAKEQLANARDPARRRT